MYFLLAFVLVAGMGLLIAFFFLPKHQNPILPEGVNSPEVGSTYLPHGRITINGNGNFTALPGGGTQADPYLITGLNISCDNKEGCVSITNTDKHLLITNCYFNVAPGSYPCEGIIIQNATNVTVLYCIFSNVTAPSGFYAWGIIARNSTDLEISGNTFQNFWAGQTDGVALLNCSRVVFEKNYFIWCYQGILIATSSSNITIANNLMERCNAGVFIIQSSSNITIAKNYMERCFYGVYGEFSSNLNITDNLFC